MNRDSGRSSRTGVVVLGHGSRAPEAAVLLEWIAGKMAEKCDFPVAPASLQFNSPTLEDACRRLAAEGARRIVVTPYFLFSGNHMKIDIPEELGRIEAELPGVELLMAQSLGADDRLVDVMKGRVMEALTQFEPEPAVKQMNEDGRSPSPGASAGLPQHQIEAESFDIIDEILQPLDAAGPGYQIARRVVHATGDPSLADVLLVSGDAISESVEALRSGARIICDVNMVRAGVEPTAARMGIEVFCHVGSEETRMLAQEEDITRGAAGIRRASEHHRQAPAHCMSPESQTADGLLGAVIAIGNAPTALYECLRLCEMSGARPAVIVGVPVGFVGAAESKEALIESGLPHITLPGNRGGSNVAVAIVNALLRLAAEAGGETA